MTEMLSPGRDESRVFLRTRRRRRRVDLRPVAMGVALFIAVAWTILFGVGIVLH